MAKQWIATLKYQIGNGSEHMFTGRTPVMISEPDKSALLDLGVFTEEQDGKLRYSGNASIRGTDDANYVVGQDGIVDIPSNVIPENTQDELEDL